MCSPENDVEISSNDPFDERYNTKARLYDLKLPLIESYLHATDDPIADEMYGIPFRDLVARMHLVDGPVENPRPTNAALMFFNNRPDDFFREARIEITVKSDPAGRDMTIKDLRGPLDAQLRGALDYIRSNVLEEKTLKLDDRPEAERFFNYPISAIEEALSNAVYHKSYQIPEPISVVITRDRMEITSVPGPDRSISDEDLRNGRMICKRYRNRRIGDYLKELGLAEGKNTGVPLMMEAMEVNGSDRPSFITDDARSFFTVVLPIHRYYLKKDVLMGDIMVDADPAVSDERKRRRTRQEIIDEVLSIVSERESVTMKELAELMGYRSQSSSLKAVVSMLVSDGTLDYTMGGRTDPRQEIRMGHRSR